MSFEHWLLVAACGGAGFFVVWNIMTNELSPTKSKTQRTSPEVSLTKDDLAWCNLLGLDPDATAASIEQAYLRRVTELSTDQMISDEKRGARLVELDKAVKAGLRCAARNR